MTELAPIPVFLAIVHAFCRLLIFPQNIFLNNSFKHNSMYPNVKQFVP